MYIHRVFNNNVVSILENDAEAILTGRGLGFQKRPGDPVDTDRVAQRFVLDSDRSSTSTALLSDLPYEVLRLLQPTSALLHDRLSLVMKTPALLALGDHIAAALERSRAGTQLVHPLLWEIKNAYRREFTVALELLRLIERETGQRLQIDEVGYLTMHLVNGGVDGDMTETLRTTATVQGVLGLIRQRITIIHAIDSNDYSRFLTHIKYFVQRIEEGRPLHDHQPELFAALRDSSPDVYTVAVAVGDFVTERYGMQVPDEELFYLMLHISRIHDPARL